MRILVTGGRSAIGQAMIHHLTQKEHTVLTTGSTDASIKEMRRAFGSYTNISLCKWDIQAPEIFSENLIEFLTAGIDAIVLNAAQPPHQPLLLHEFPPEDIRTFVNAELTANFYLLQKCLPKMVTQKFGRILLISSVAVYGTHKKCLYSMAKCAQEAMIKSIATDYGRYSISANIIRPGIIKTQRNSKFWNHPGHLQALKTLIPSQQIGSPESIAEAIDPFLSKSSYINGACLDISGGWPMISGDAMAHVAENLRRYQTKNKNS